MMKANIKKGLEMPKGGKREGAGRPLKIEAEGKPPRTTLGVRVEQATYDFVYQESKDTDKSAGEIVDIAIDDYRKKRGL